VDELFDYIDKRIILNRLWLFYIQFSFIINFSFLFFLLLYHFNLFFFTKQHYIIKLTLDSSEYELTASFHEYISHDDLLEFLIVFKYSTCLPKYISQFQQSSKLTYN